MFDQEQVEAFLYQEAELLDNKSLAAWLELLTEDVLYWMPLKRDQHWQAFIPEGTKCCDAKRERNGQADDQ